MKLIFLLIFTLQANTSLVIPYIDEAIKGIITPNKFISDAKVLEIVHLIESKNISIETLKKISQKLSRKAANFYLLPTDDYADQLIKKSINKEIVEEDYPVSLHAYRFDVIEEFDDWLNDDIYMYFFVTDGLIPTAKSTSIYRNNDQGDQFFLGQSDRVIFPIGGKNHHSIQKHLIVDYGIIESDGDDVLELQKLSSIIIDIALVIYGASSPAHAPLLGKLRKEVKNMANLLLNLNRDDQMATQTLAWDKLTIKNFLKDSSMYHFSKLHYDRKNYSRWKYRVNFRFLR